MPDIILHNYPQSPVAEKVRVALRIKGIEWRSVEIPRLPPKPLLTALTGGYRRTPVMQIGADMFCDSLCIIRELERRHPEPSLHAENGQALAWAFAQWSDGQLFEHAIKLVLGAAGDALPRDFAEDRGRLYLGPDWAEGLKTAHAELQHNAAQIRGQLGWLDSCLAHGRQFLFGDHPTLSDALAYHVIWFVRTRWDQGPEFLSEFKSLEAWEERIFALGYGVKMDLSAEKAMEIAAEHDPATLEAADPLDPQRLAPGMKVMVVPDVDGGEQSIAGSICSVDRETVSIIRSQEGLGQICVHFPRVGYRVTLV